VREQGSRAIPWRDASEQEMLLLRWPIPPTHASHDFIRHDPGADLLVRCRCQQHRLHSPNTRQACSAVAGVAGQRPHWRCPQLPHAVGCQRDAYLWPRAAATL
jgi:hypothetical protein